MKGIRKYPPSSGSNAIVVPNGGIRGVEKPQVRGGVQVRSVEKAPRVY